MLKDFFASFTAGMAIIATIIVFDEVFKLVIKLWIVVSEWFSLQVVEQKSRLPADDDSADRTSIGSNGKKDQVFEVNRPG